MNDRKIQWIHFSEFVATIAIFLGCFGWLGSRLDRQSERTDRLYELYQETNQTLSEYRRESDAKWEESLQKLSDYRKESDQRFYDMLREGKAK